MQNETKYITKVTLSNGKTYIIKDNSAIRAGETITGDVDVDAKIRTNQLFIMSSETMLYTPTNVLVEDESTHEIKKRDTNLLLEDIGGYSCQEEDLENGILTLKLGK